MTAIDQDYDIDTIREEWIGRTTEVRRGRYPVEHDPIRRHCQMIEDLNPAHIGPDGVVAPPVMLDYFAGSGWWPLEAPIPPLVIQVPTPGDRYINLNQEMLFHAPVRVGDHLSSQDVIVDVFVKAIKLDPQAVWVTYEQRITNQHGALVSTIRNTSLAHREPAAEHASPPAATGEPPAPVPTVAAATAADPTVVRFWDDVADGESIPGFDLFLSETKVVEQVSGSQDFYPVHHDREFARAGGHRDIFFNTGFTRGALGRLLGDYAGSAGSVRRLQYAMRKMSYPGDTVSARGVVTTKRIDDDGQALVELDIALHNDREGVATPGTATVALPRR